MNLLKMISFSELTKQVHTINDIILADMICGRDSTTEYANFRNHLQTTKNWFSRISWANKKSYILALLEDVRSAWALSWLLKSMWNCRPKDAIESANESTVWSSYDQVPMDHNRTAQKMTTLAQVMKIDRLWFLNLEPQTQAMVLSELLSISGGPVMWEVLRRAQLLYERYRNKELQNLQECVVVKEAPSEKPSSVPATPKNKKEQQEVQTSEQRKSSGVPTTPDWIRKLQRAAPGQAQAQLDANLAIWNATIKSMQDSLKLEELEMIFKDGSRRKIWKVNRPRPEAIETVDFVQLLPSAIGKRILSYLPRAQLGNYAAANKYWAFLIDDLKAELVARQKIDADLEKLREQMLRHDKSNEMMTADIDDGPPNSLDVVSTGLSLRLKTVQPSVRASEKSAGYSFRNFVQNKLDKPSKTVQRPIKNMREFMERLDRRGACDDNIWNWCKNVLRNTKSKKRNQDLDEGVIPLENMHFPCPMMKEKLEIPLRTPLVKDPANNITVKSNKNISSTTIHMAKEQGAKRYSLWTKDFSSLYPVFKISSYQSPI